jgi:hypothetical protein
MKRILVRLKNRAILILGGAWIAWYGWARLQTEGVFPYYNIWRQPVFPSGLVATGVFIMALGLFFSGDWVYRLLKTRQRQKPHVLRKANRHYN